LSLATYLYVSIITIDIVTVSVYVVIFKRNVFAIYGVAENDSII